MYTWGHKNKSKKDEPGKCSCFALSPHNSNPFELLGGQEKKKKVAVIIFHYLFSDNLFLQFFFADFNTPHLCFIHFNKCRKNMNNRKSHRKYMLNHYSTKSWHHYTKETHKNGNLTNNKEEGTLRHSWLKLTLRSCFGIRDTAQVGIPGSDSQDFATYCICTTKSAIPYYPWIDIYSNQWNGPFPHHVRCLWFTAFKFWMTLNQRMYKLHLVVS